LFASEPKIQNTMDTIKMQADLILHLVASEHFGRVSLQNDELNHPTPVRLAMNYALKRYKEEQSRIDPNAAELDNWQGVFWHLSKNHLNR
jgi:hypothetical protein